MHAIVAVLCLCGAIASALEVPPALHKVKYVAPIDPPPTLSPAQRAAALLAQMNITEKITMVHGWDTPYVGGVIANTRLGIPALNLNDGPQVGFVLWSSLDLSCTFAYQKNKLSLESY